MNLLIYGLMYCNTGFNRISRSLDGTLFTNMHQIFLSLCYFIFVILVLLRIPVIYYKTRNGYKIKKKYEWFCSQKIFHVFLLFSISWQFIINYTAYILYLQMKWASIQAQKKNLDHLLKILKKFRVVKIVYLKKVCRKKIHEQLFLKRLKVSAFFAMMP